MLAAPLNAAASCRYSHNSLCSKSARFARCSGRSSGVAVEENGGAARPLKGNKQSLIQKKRAGAA